jgi:HAD superfamily hydrolase (TIGR01549 family)
VIRAVLFDLDDTLFDHRHCARSALAELHGRYPEFRGCEFADLERRHAEYLEDLHARVTAGEIALDEAREERFRRLFASAGVEPDRAVIADAAATYRTSYLTARQPVAGAAALLAAVHARARVAIVSNNVLQEQQDKLRHCGLEPFVDVLIVSAETGMSKPDPRIFRIVLERLDCPPHEAVMVGDSWAADIAGAHAAGLRAIWFNPAGRPRPDGERGVAELRSFEPVETALDTIFQEDEARRVEDAHRH